MERAPENADEDPPRPSGASTGGPWGASSPAHVPPSHAPPPARRAGRRQRRFSSYAVAALLLCGFAATAYKDLARPEAWAYWTDLYFSHGMTASVVPDAVSDRSGRRRPALALSGRIGAAAAGWLRDRLDEAHLRPGDAVVFSSPGGDLNQAIIMGEIIRSRGLSTAVGTFDGSGRLRPSYCASACVVAYAGGTIRIGVAGSRLGVHRFTTPTTGADVVADTQRTAGQILGYMTRMGVSPSIVEAMSATDAVHWLGASEAIALNLVTDPAVPGPLETP